MFFCLSSMLRTLQLNMINTSWTLQTKITYSLTRICEIVKSYRLIHLIKCSYFTA